MKNNVLLFCLLCISLIRCGDKNASADAYGNFESRDVLVTAEIPGRLLFLSVAEGTTIEKGDTIGLVDTVSLHLKQTQLESSIQAIRKQLQDPGPQIRLLEKQIDVLEKEKTRLLALIADEAATPKQLDDLQGKLDVLQQQISTTRDQNAIANRAILSQIAPLQRQIEQIRDQISRCYIVNPLSGTVLMQLTEPGELVSPQKALYKIARLDQLEIRAYLSGDQLGQISLGQEVWVKVDGANGKLESMPGKVSWIADQAEFTPKTIQTREERVNLVYAFKVQVENSTGMLKLGMPGEVYFRDPGKENQ